MNEHIKLLAEHATCYTMSWIDIDGVSTPLERGEIFDKELFAKLIVQECALQCVHNEDMDLIEKHFGVEE
jgi:hypothetical protein